MFSSRLSVAKGQTNNKKNTGLLFPSEECETVNASSTSCTGLKMLLDETAEALREREGPVCFRATNWAASIFCPQPESILVDKDCRLE